MRERPVLDRVKVFELFSPLSGLLGEYCVVQKSKGEQQAFKVRGNDRPLPPDGHMSNRSVTEAGRSYLRSSDATTTPSLSPLLLSLPPPNATRHIPPQTPPHLLLFLLLLPLSLLPLH
ncbi:hypothetical protein E2C01_100668 [Portunus trituberculatus]|uniref:Uncharacterized protein n=1 Tax=Portunus trituberculatus TaxID=210409 RepID=A0A5B7K8N3_PORTR|nr:hypothetical protein [Portunus trituberculatus]